MRFILNVHSFARFGQWTAAVAIAATIAGAPPARAEDPVFAATYFEVGTGAVPQGIDLLKKYRETSSHEPGNLEFTVVQETRRPNRFVIFEGWSDQAVFDAHTKAASTTQFLDALKPIRNSPPDRHMLQPFANSATHTAPPGGAIYMVEHVDFIGSNPTVAAEAQPLIKTLAESSRKEPAAVRYDIYRQPPPRINHYEVVAVWTDEKAFDTHEMAPHTLQFRATSAAVGGSVPRVNLYDQRVYKAL